jgi:hypothetical protein
VRKTTETLDEFAVPPALRSPKAIATRFLPDAAAEEDGTGNLAGQSAPASETAKPSPPRSPGEAGPSSSPGETLNANEEKVK